MENVFSIHKEDLNENTVLTVLSLDALSDDLTALLDENLVAICEGEFSTSELDDVKRRLLELFQNKESKVEEEEYSTWEMGAVAELFIHLYVKSIGLRQECMFFNLEDRSAKKGFDGYYSDDNLHWIMESKSGLIATKGNTHGTKLKEALTDLKGKFTGKGTTNNPWREAYNHASQIDVGSAENIRKYIKELAVEYTSGVFHEPAEFNVIPCSTLYYEETNFETNEEITALANDALSESEHKKGHFICVSSKSVGIFMQYMKGSD